MSTKIKSYPNPVFGNGDDYRINIDNAVTFGNIEKDKDNFYCVVTLNLDDESILNLIKEKKAAFFCEIDCVKTNYRSSKWDYSKSITIQIPRYQIVDNVDINCYVIAMDSIDNFTHPEFNEMFENTTFSLEKGDFIATLGSYYFNATVKYNKCPAPSSLIQVQRATSDSGIKQIKFTHDEERIYIVMPEYLYNIYNSVFGQNSNASDIFISTIVVDALAYSLMILHDNDNDSDTKLAENLRNLMEKNNIVINDNHPEEYFDVARKLLEEDGIDPYTTFMKNVQAIITTLNNNNNGITE